MLTLMCLELVIVRSSISSVRPEMDQAEANQFGLRTKADSAV